MKQSGIYIISSLLFPEQIYIGSSIDIKDRWKQHRSQLKRNRHHSPLLQWHYNKYGKDDLLFRVFIEVHPSLIHEVEEFLLKRCDPYFNLNKSAIGRGTRSHSLMTKMKISKSMMGKNTWSKGRIPWNKGLTKETSPILAKIGLVSRNKNKGQVPWNKGKKIGHHTKEHGDKISLSLKLAWKEKRHSGKKKYVI